MTAKWRYIVVPWYFQNLEDMLNGYAGEGWELSTITEDYRHVKLLVFKKPKKS